MSGFYFYYFENMDEKFIPRSPPRRGGAKKAEG